MEAVEEAARDGIEEKYREQEHEWGDHQVVR
jgi:hypothetical protein